MTQQSVCWQDLETLELLMPEKIQRVFAFGPSATGKSHFGFALARKLGVEAYAVTLNQDTSAAELIGYYLPDGQGGARWRAGLGALARSFAQQLHDGFPHFGAPRVRVPLGITDQLDTRTKLETAKYDPRGLRHCFPCRRHLGVELV